jgi:hypothetical protein
LLVDDAHGMGNLADARPHFIIYPFCCQFTHMLLNRHVFCCPLADSKTSILSPDTDFGSQQLDIIYICDG